ncbi:MAG: ribose 5-phosphate isomerase B [Crocinitomix sp.]|nr:ribose 5-phosphate isomerase B [Crocinitomix sp.]
MLIPIGCDHAGVDLKEIVKAHLITKGFQVEDYGTNGPDSVDYPDFGHKVADHVTKAKGLGIVICGSGNGINMTVNKHQAIRSALCWTVEIASLARLHNDANIIAVPARFVSTELALEMIDTFLATDFEGGRHGRRVNKISC